MTTIGVDWTRCDGHGLCARLLHEKITLDEWGFPIIDDPVVDPALVTAARRAALACPAMALRVDKGPRGRRARSTAASSAAEPAE